MNGEVFKHDPNEEKWVDPYPKKKRGLQRVMIVIFLLSLYVLSTGPASYLRNTGKVSGVTLGKIYYPLIQLSHAAPPIADFFAWYVHFWIPRNTQLYL